MSNIYLVSLGCDKNRVDGEIMIGTLRNAGYSVIFDPKEADVIIVNTCGFISDAVQESIDMVLELAENKTDGNCKALIVVGCMAKRYEDEIKKTIPECDETVGVNEYDKIAEVVKKYIEPPKAKKIEITDPYLQRIAARKDDVIPHIAYVKIAEGCDNHCSYCTIPSIRGGYKSRKIESILEECNLLVKEGVREIVLVAQDTSLYGTDIYKEKKLSELLYKLAEIEDLQWIRLMYVYPEHITKKLINAIKDIKKVCKYIDMPLQHSEEPVLSRMRRNGDNDSLFKLIMYMRNEIPNLALRTTFIVGFPGETAGDFKKLQNFIKEVEFDRLGVFPYSQEEGTSAAEMPDQISEGMKTARHKKIMELQQKIHFAAAEKKVGKVLSVMIDEHTNGEYIGRTQADAYEVDTIVTFTSEIKLKPGQIVDVKVTAAENYDLRGVKIESGK